MLTHDPHSIFQVNMDTSAKSASRKRKRKSSKSLLETVARAQVQTQDMFMKGQVQQAEIIKTMAEGFSALTSAMQSTDKKTTDRLDKFESKLEDYGSKLSVGMSDGSLESKFYSKLPLLFNPLVGVACYVPVDFVDVSGIVQKLVVISIAMMVWYFTKEVSMGLDEAEVRSFFCSPTNFPRFWTKFDRRDFQSLILKTPFRPYAVGKDSKPNSLTKNEERFVVTPLAEFQTLLERCCERYPILGNVTFKTKWPERAGQKYAFRARDWVDASTGPISELGGLELSKTSKKLVPAMGVEWWKDLMTPSVKQVLEVCGKVPLSVSFETCEERQASAAQAVLDKVRRKKISKNKRARENKRQREQVPDDGIESLD